MTRAIALVTFVLVGASCMGQSKIYVAAGVHSVFGSGVNILLGSAPGIKLSYPAVDAEYERRVIGAFSAVGGVSFFQAGYNATDDSFSSASLFKATYIGMPVMARWNAGNKNVLLVDFGVVPFYLVNAHLRESVEEFGSRKTVEGDITPYSNRFYYAGKVDFMVMLNRFYLGWYVVTPSKGQSTLKNLQQHWGLNAEQSTYLLSNGFSDYVIFGVRLGVRIR